MESLHVHMLIIMLSQSLNAMQGQAVSGTVSLRSVSSIATRSMRHISAPRGSPQLRSLAVYAYRPEVQTQESGGGRKFADFAVYKGKGALCLKVRAISPKLSLQGYLPIIRHSM